MTLQNAKLMVSGKMATAYRVFSVLCSMHALLVHRYSIHEFLIAESEAMDVYNLSLSNAAWSYSIEAPSIVKLLHQGQTITAIAMLMYSPTTLQQVF